MKPAAAAIAALTLLATGVQASPLREPVVGPTQVCFKYSSFSLSEGERVTDFSPAPESMGIEVEGPNGRYDVVESELFYVPNPGRALREDHGTSVFRAKRRSREYLIAGVTGFSRDKSIVVVSVSGPALTGTRRDALIYDRFIVGDPAQMNCPDKFTYSWQAFLGAQKQ
jgi:hypothetical protein